MDIPSHHYPLPSAPPCEASTVPCTAKKTNQAAAPLFSTLGSNLLATLNWTVKTVLLGTVFYMISNQSQVMTPKTSLTCFAIAAVIITISNYFPSSRTQPTLLHLNPFSRRNNDRRSNTQARFSSAAPAPAQPLGDIRWTQGAAAAPAPSLPQYFRSTNQHEDRQPVVTAERRKIAGSAPLSSAPTPIGPFATKEPEYPTNNQKRAGAGRR